MQLVINIDEDEYEYIKEYGLFGYGVPSTKSPLEDAIKNGTPLDDIKAEIRQNIGDNLYKNDGL